jgi:hypothetical protein
MVTAHADDNRNNNCGRQLGLIHWQTINSRWSVSATWHLHSTAQHSKHSTAQQAQQAQHSAAS